MSEYKIATICGTMRLVENMRTMADELTRQGYIVLMPHTLKGVSSLANPSPVSDYELDRMHLAKIDMADLVVFVTQERRLVWGVEDEHDRTLYFGESTNHELDYARGLGKGIRFVRLKREMYRDTIIEVRMEDVLRQRMGL